MTEELGYRFIPEFGSQPEHLEGFAQMHPPALRLAGLNLSEPGQTGATIADPQGAAEASEEVSVQLENGQAFCDFLERAAEQSARPSGFDEAAQTASDHLLQDVVGHISAGSPDDSISVISTIAFSGTIADKLEALALDDDAHRKLVEQFRACHQHANTNTLREWVAVSELHLFDSADTQAAFEHSGPAVWHQSMDPLGAAQQWEKILSVIEATGKHPAAAVFHHAVVRAARANLSTAHRDWLARRDTPDTPQATIDRLHDKAFKQLFDRLQHMLAEPTTAT